MASTTTKRVAAAAVGVAGAGLAVKRALDRDEIRFARMGGNSIAAPDAAGWVTDFLNAAYYARRPEERDPDDLRLAFAIVTTRWYRGGRRLHAHDVVAFHRAFGRRRLHVGDGEGARRGTLDRAELLAGGAKLFGDWFPAAYADDARRGWGVVFETPAEKAAYVPERRLALAKLGELTPAAKPLTEQVWHTYAPVEVPDADAIVAALTKPETWPDYATAIGRFTPLRSGGLAGQTFEIEVTAQPVEKAPIFTRGYVTITRLVTHAQPDEIAAYVAELNEKMARVGRDEPQPVPDDATPLVAFDLTTHGGHFMGRGNNRLLLYTQGGKAYVRAAGTWDDMPWHLDQAYKRAGADAQAAFWGEGTPEESLLHQLALRTAPAPALKAAPAAKPAAADPKAAR
jgi:hypothetical protein